MVFHEIYPGAVSQAVARMGKAPGTFIKVPFMQKELILPKGPGEETMKWAIEFPEKILGTAKAFITNTFQGKGVEPPKNKAYHVPTMQEEMQDALYSYVQGAPWYSVPLAITGAFWDLSIAGGFLKTGVKTLSSQALDKAWVDAWDAVGRPSAKDLKSTRTELLRKLSPDNYLTGNEAKFKAANSAFQVLEKKGIPNPNILQKAGEFTKKLEEPAFTISYAKKPYVDLEGLLTERAGYEPIQPYQPYRKPAMGLSMRDVRLKPIKATPEAISGEKGKIIPYKEEIKPVKAITPKVSGGAITDLSKSITKEITKPRFSYAQKIDTVARLNEKKMTTQSAKTSVERFAKEVLSPQDRGKFITTVRNAKTTKDVLKAFSRISDYSEKIEVNEAISTLRKTVDKMSESNSISADYRNKIKDIIDKYELSGHREDTIKSLKDTQEYLTRKASIGEDVSLPQSVLNRLKILSRTPKEELTMQQVEGLQNEIEMLAKLGETKWAGKEALYNAEKEARTNILLGNVSPINSKIIKQGAIGENPSGYIKAYIKFRNYLQKSRIGLTPIDGLADITGMQPMKAALDSDFGNYLEYNDEAIKKWYELTKDFDEANFERIGAFAISQQEGGLERLANRGITEQMINDLKLTSEENTAYKFLREKFDSEFPAVKKYALDVYNRDVGEVKNYVSFMADNDVMSDLEIYDRFGSAPDFSMKTKTVEQGFTKERSALSTQKLELNIDKIFRRHLDNVAYMLTTGRDVKMYFEIVNSPAMREKLGDVGSLAWLQYLDLMARKGGAEGAKRIAVLDILRKNIQAGILSFRISSALVQFSSFADTLATMGAEWATKGASAISTSREWRDFIIDNFPEVRKAIGDDVAFRELGDGLFGKISEKGITPLKFLDGLMRSTAASAAYQKLAFERGIAVDLTNPDKGLVQEATKLMRYSQGSSFFKDQPLSITAGFGITENRSLNKTILTFQSFMLNRWDNILRQIWRLGIKEKDYKKASMSFFWIVIFATALEETIRRTTKWTIGKISSLFGGEEPKFDSLTQDFILNLIQNVPVLGQIVSSMTYSSNPVPVINALEDVISGGGSLIKGKSWQTKLKGLITEIGALGSLFGLGGSSQAAQLLKGIVPAPEVSKSSGLPGLPELPRLPRLPKLPKLQ
jgi:hypothetical protein